MKRVEQERGSRHAVRNHFTRFHTTFVSLISRDNQLGAEEETVPNCPGGKPDSTQGPLTPLFWGFWLYH